MLRVEKIGKRLISFKNLKPKPLTDFYELGDFIANSPKEFFDEINETLFVVGSNVRTGDDQAPVADVLALDSNGAAVVAMIHSPGNSLGLSHAMHAASNVADWKAEDFRKRLTGEQAWEMGQFLGEKLSELNRSQRVFLIAETHEESLINMSSWLSERYGMDVRCIQVALGEEVRSGDEYLTCSVLLRSFTTEADPLVAPEASATETDEPAEPPTRPQAPADTEPPDPVEAAAMETLREANKPWNPDPPAFDDGPLELPELDDDTPIFDESDFDEPELELEPPPAPAPEPEAPSFPEDKRLHERAEFPRPSVSVHYAGRQMLARLVDCSQGGAGLEMLSPLPTGAQVTIEGRIESTEQRADLNSRGRISHCRFSDPGFRLGIAFDRLLPELAR